MWRRENYSDWSSLHHDQDKPPSFITMIFIRRGNGGASSSPPSSPSGWGSAGCSSSGTCSFSPPSSVITPLLFRLLKFIFCREVSPAASPEYVFGLEGPSGVGTVQICQHSCLSFGSKYLIVWIEIFDNLEIEIFDWQQEEEYWERRPAVDKNEVSARTLCP